MISEYDFRDIRKYLEKDNDTEVLDAINHLADAAIIFTPVVFGMQFLPLLDLLDIKDRLFNLGKTVIRFIASKKEPDYVTRLEQLRTAYSLICYTAYFDSLSENLPKSLIKKLKEKLKDSPEFIASNAPENTSCSESFTVHNDLPYVDHITSFNETLEILLDMYKEISRKLSKIVIESKLVKEDSHLKELNEVLNEKLPKEAVERYKAQYLYLADTFSDFGFFAQGVEFSALNNAAKEHSAALDHIKSAMKIVDVGLVNLYQVVNSIHLDYAAILSQEIVDDLKAKYKAMIEEPIIDDKEITPTQEKTKLIFPKIIEAFIPQSYKCLLYNSNIKLEDEKTWKNLEAKDDLDLFFIRFLYSRDSINTPLIILGHPGSGKSLLTKVLSAQLTSELYTVIRIPLREVNAGLTIDLLVEDQIRRLTQHNLPQGGYGVFAKQFKEKPLLVILDGYDELLQAKGAVFSQYLDRVMRFQHDQKDLNRPVRVIVTSRITLIDKAIVPENSTILRLLEFNADQRNKWIEIWNQANNEYFKSHQPKIKPFKLPSMEINPKTKKKNSIIELAEQPLLLLMLALYDSEGNSLCEHNDDLKRTALYNNLLRRFVRRERSIYITGLNNMPLDNQNAIIDNEMKRLGVVAIGMFNRKKLSISTKELDNDLVEFECERKREETIIGKLKDSEALLGGFFFIHQSTAKDVTAHSDKSESAFEFLHNTFGEFLTADIILSLACYEAQAICACSKDQFLIKELQAKLNSPNGLSKQWFTCLMFTPLFSRPVILEMIREHISHVISECSIDEGTFYKYFEMMIKSQLKMFLSANEFPNAMMMSHGVSQNIPLLGFASIYTLNLVILASVLFKEGFIFDETEYGSQNNASSETHPWEKLTFLWRTWFSIENLTGLSMIFDAKRDGTRVSVKCHEKFEAASLSHPIDIQLSVFYTLSDALNAGLAGLQSRNFEQVVNLDSSKILELLKNENEDLYFSFLVNCLRNIMHYQLKENNETSRSVQLDILIKEITTNINPIVMNPTTVHMFFEILEFGYINSAFLSQTKKRLYIYLSDLLQRARRLDESSNISKRAITILEKYSKDIILLDSKRRIWEQERWTKIERFDNIHFNSSNISNNANEYIDLITNNISYNQEAITRLVRSEVDSRNIYTLASTNPELATRILLLQSSKEKEEGANEKVIRIILDDLLECGLEFVGHNAIINLIKLAHFTRKRQLQEEVHLTLIDVLRNYRSEYFFEIFFTNPYLFEAFTDLNLFHHLDMQRIFRYFINDEIHRENKPQLKNEIIAYIRIARKLHAFQSQRANEYENAIVVLINKMIPRRTQDLLLQYCISNLTLDDISNLYWFALNQGNRGLCEEIKRKLGWLIGNDGIQ